MRAPCEQRALSRRLEHPGSVSPAARWLFPLLLSRPVAGLNGNRGAKARPVDDEVAGGAGPRNWLGSDDNVRPAARTIT